MSRTASKALRRRGFTLVEVLVAMSVSALVAALAYQSLAAAADAAEASQAVAEQVDNIDRVWQFVERDLRQAVKLPQAVADQQQSPAAVVSSGEDFPAFLGSGVDGDSQYANDGFLLRFRRGGWVNPLQQERSHLQGVGYRLEEGKLFRIHWPILNSASLEEDAIAELEPYQHPLLEGVESVALRFLPAGAKDIGEWVEQWPADEQASKALPLAVEMVLSVSDFGASRRVFLIPVEA